MKRNRRARFISADDYYERHSHETINKILSQTKSLPYDQMRSAIRSSYPFGEKKGRPYKTWIRILLTYETRLSAGQYL